MKVTYKQYDKAVKFLAFWETIGYDENNPPNAYSAREYREKVKEKRKIIIEYENQYKI